MEEYKTIMTIYSMNLTLRRKTVTALSTRGALYINNVFECFTLEPPPRHHPLAARLSECIQAGTYKIEISHSERFGKQMPRLLDVPGHLGILIHPGNFPTDTEGCILVGRSAPPGTTDYIGDSRQAFGALFEKMKNTLQQSGPVTIEIIDEYT